MPRKYLGEVGGIVGCVRVFTISFIRKFVRIGYAFLLTVSNGKFFNGSLISQLSGKNKRLWDACNIYAVVCALVLSGASETLTSRLGGTAGFRLRRRLYRRADEDQWWTE